MGADEFKLEAQSMIMVWGGVSFSRVRLNPTFHFGQHHIQLIHNIQSQHASFLPFWILENQHEDLAKTG